MRIPRLLILSALILAWIPRVVAQSPEKDTASPPADTLDLQRKTPGAPGTNDYGFSVRTPSKFRPHVLALEQNDATCYSMRLYRVKRDDADSDSTRPAGYSTCQPAARFQVKTAVDSIEIAPAPR
jgi:hypothetical protein